MNLESLSHVETVGGKTQVQQLMRVRRSRGHSRIPGGVHGVTTHTRGDFLVDETVEGDVGPSGAAILAHQAGVLVQKAVQHT